MGIEVYVQDRHFVAFVTLTSAHIVVVLIFIVLAVAVTLLFRYLFDKLAEKIE